MRVAFFGARGVGKSTAAEYFNRREIDQGNISQVIRFGDCLKFAYIEAFNSFNDAIGVSFNNLDIDRLEATKNFHRPALEFFGTTYARNTLGYNVWLDKVEFFISNNDDSIFVADGRFLNEADYLRDEGFTIVLIEDAYERDVSVAERELNKLRYDFKLFNDRTFKGFIDDVRDLYDVLT